MARQQIDSTGRFPRWSGGIRVKIDHRVDARSMHVDFWKPIEEGHGKSL